MLKSHILHVQAIDVKIFWKKNNHIFNFFFNEKFSYLSYFFGLDDLQVFAKIFKYSLRAYSLDHTQNKAKESLQKVKNRNWMLKTSQGPAEVFSFKLL